MVDYRKIKIRGRLREKSFRIYWKIKSKGGLKEKSYNSPIIILYLFTVNPFPAREKNPKTCKIQSWNTSLKWKMVKQHKQLRLVALTIISFIDLLQSSLHSAVAVVKLTHRMSGDMMSTNKDFYSLWSGLAKRK